MKRAVALIVLALAACQGAEPARPVVTTIDRPRPVANRDDLLKSVASRKLAELDRAAFRAVTVEVWGGRALLMGAVVKPEQRRRAEQTVKGVTGMGEVINELVLAEAAALDHFALDFPREESLRHHLGADAKAGLIVRVVNGVAFLLGGGSPESAAALKANATEVDGIKWAVNHIVPSLESTP
jgi:hyperosmotically inducible protein